MKNKVKKMRIKQLFVAALLVSLCAVSIPSVYALFSGVTQVAENNFKGGVVNIAVVEKGEREDASNNKETYNKISVAGQSETKQVAIKNKAAASYVRVSLEATLVSDDDASVMYLDGADVTYHFATGTAWKYDSSNDVYYYTKVLANNETSDRLLESVTLNQNIPTGYHLEVKVLSDAISANPVSNLRKAWNVDFTTLEVLR